MVLIRDRFFSVLNFFARPGPRKDLSLFSVHYSQCRGTSQEYVDLFTINPDGTDLTRITISADGETYPSISADGLRIVYMVNFRLFVMNIDGTGAHRLDARGRTDEDPAWSPEFTN